jgi:hypothetical protein
VDDGKSKTDSSAALWMTAKAKTDSSASLWNDKQKNVE